MKKYEWNLALLYKSPTDPAIDRDVAAIEAMCETFAKRYDIPGKVFQRDENVLFQALEDYEKIMAKGMSKALQYFYFVKDTDSSNEKASSQISLLTNRLTSAGNKITFFQVNLGEISELKQKEFLNNPKLAHFKFFLKCTFDDAKHRLSVAEENIMSLKSLPARDLWNLSHNRILGSETVAWKGKNIPLAEAQNKLPELSTPKERKALAEAMAATLKRVSPFSEAELNAVMTNKKIDDELLKFKTPYDSTILTYRNDSKVVENLVSVVKKRMSLAHRFYKIKAKMLKQKKLGYYDRAAKVGQIKTKFSFEDSIKSLTKTFNDIDPKFGKILNSFIKNGQIDAFPRKGKTSGAYCWGSFEDPTFVLLNHSDTLNSYTTFAHEMGHAIHTELSRSQGAMYHDYSFSLAETASTLFESIALDAVFEKLNPKEKIVVLHDKIQDDIATIFRQIACFNFELDLHTEIRSKGFIPKERIAELHNKNMKEYLGPIFEMKPDDGYFFVMWSHLRRFFYVYSYAYGQLVTKALLRRYHKDKNFWKSIEKFLSAGGKATPEEILKEIGIDVYSPAFFEEGLKEIEEDIVKLEKMC